MLLNYPPPSQSVNTPDTLSRIVEQKELRVGYVVVPPWIIKEPNTGELSGSAVDAMREIGRLAGIKISFVESSWPTFIAGLHSDTYDVSIVPSYVTVGRATTVNFTRPISYTSNSVLVKEEMHFSTLRDIDRRGMVVVVVQGTQDQEFAERFFVEATVRAVATQDIPMVLSEVLTGRADAALADTYNINQFVASNKGVKNGFPAAPYNVLPASWAVRYEDTSLWQFLNSALINLEGNGYLRYLDEKYAVPNDRPFWSPCL